mgnify:CR=1 FL=1
MLQLFSNFFIIHENDMGRINCEHLFYVNENNIKDICSSSVDAWKDLKKVGVVYHQNEVGNDFIEYFMFFFGKQKKYKAIKDLKLLNHCHILD